MYYIAPIASGSARRSAAEFHFGAIGGAISRGGKNARGGEGKRANLREKERRGGAEGFHESRESEING